MKKSRMIRKIGSVLFLLMIVAVLSGKNSYAKENNTYLDVGTYAGTETGYCILYGWCDTALCNGYLEKDTGAMVILPYKSK